ncbi:hypothetical protein [Sulfitobacter sp. R18_1]|uniref:hypothetical protein n=1 Tax=Sulfitobacter sp. R18_1 TaxID=2821104 RepID=UPI001ADADCA7|nr:hypothetical protein [Sulfitobacter sp. R18_1]MBO9428275.1 hypothetical protein [Sulfitobacter sp. R18_1]
MAWTKEKPSKKELRRITKKFRNDADFEAPYCAPWERLYDSAEEAKKSLPEI